MSELKKLDKNMNLGKFKYIYNLWIRVKLDGKIGN